MGSVNSVDLYRDAVLIPATVWADHVRQLRRGALRTDTASRSLETPIGRTAASGLGFAGLALGDSHRSSLSPETGKPVTLRWNPRTQGPQIGVRPV